MSAANVTYSSNVGFSSARMVVGVFRHWPAMCRPGFYRVIPVPCIGWDLPHCDAVVDDFGDLVMVKQ